MALRRSPTSWSNRGCWTSDGRANVEIGRNMSLGDFAWAHGAQTKLFRRFN